MRQRAVGGKQRGELARTKVANFVEGETVTNQHKTQVLFAVEQVQGVPPARFLAGGLISTLSR